VVSSRPQAQAAFVSRAADGSVNERPLPVRYLGVEAEDALPAAALAA
jgi:hypothetical protein